MLTDNLIKFLFMAIILISTQVSLSDDIPVVPLSVMDKAKINTDTEQKTVKNKKLRKVSVNSNSILKMEPGVNEAIPIAIGFPNRIITPFSDPEITSTSLGTQGGKGECGEICIKDNVIYVATNKKNPLTMFINEKGSQGQALSLTMIPRKIAPRQVSLSIIPNHEGSGVPFFRNKKAKSWEESTEYMVTLRNVLRDLANNTVPQGYTINSTSIKGMARPSCSSKYFSFDFSKGQYIRGHHLGIFAGVVKNLSSVPMEVSEASCGNWNVAAVSVWPKNMLEPGEMSEIFVVMKTATMKSVQRSRPSLIGGDR